MEGEFAEEAFVALVKEAEDDEVVVARLGGEGFDDVVGLEDFALGSASRFFLGEDAELALAVRLGEG